MAPKNADEKAREKELKKKEQAAKKLQQQQEKEALKLQKKQAKEAKLGEKKKAAEPKTTRALKAKADPSAPKKSMFGFPKKKPRAEFRAEIEQLQQQLASKDREIASTNDKLTQLQSWARSAPVN
jgi:hypothetical protein